MAFTYATNPGTTGYYKLANNTLLPQGASFLGGTDYIKGQKKSGLSDYTTKQAYNDAWQWLGSSGQEVQSGFLGYANQQLGTSFADLPSFYKYNLTGSDKETYLNMLNSYVGGMEKAPTLAAAYGLGEADTAAWNEWYKQNYNQYTGLGELTATNAGVEFSLAGNADPAIAQAAATAFKEYQSAQAAGVDTTEASTKFGAAQLGYDLTNVTDILQASKDIAAFNATEMGQLLGADISMTSTGLDVPEGMTEEAFDKYISGFTQWKKTQDTAEQFGVDAADLITDPSGRMTPDPAKYNFDTLTNTYTKKDTGTTTPGTVPQTEEDWASVEDMFQQMFGSSDLYNQAYSALSQNIKTDAEIAAAANEAFAATQKEWEMFGIPEAIATGTEAGGGLGSGTQSAALRATTAFEASKSTFMQNYRNEASDRNLKYIDSALSMAKTPAEIAKVMSASGVDMAQTNLLMEQAQNLTVEEWSTKVLTEAQRGYVESMMNGQDVDSMYKLYQIAQAESGYDASYLMTLQQWYMNQYKMDDPFMALSMALLNMQTTAYYGNTSSGYSPSAIGSGIGALAGLFGS